MSVLPPQCLDSSSGPRSPPCRDFTITIGHTTLGTTPLDERSAHRKDLRTTAHNTYQRQTSMISAGFEL